MPRYPLPWFKAEGKPRDLSKRPHQRSAHLGASGNLVLIGSHSISLGIFQQMEAKERRRGSALEDAILDAAWAELGERGYAATTLEAVAKRAGGSP